MSRYHGNSDACPHCGVQYKDFRTGLTYRQVYHLEFCREYKRRSTILGAWHQLKKEWWEQHINGCTGEGTQT
jgi:predicted metal-binding protein